MDTSTQSGHLNAKSISALQYRQQELKIREVLHTHSNITKLSKDNSLPYHRVRARKAGRPSRSDRSPAGKKFTKAQELELIQDLDDKIFAANTIRCAPILLKANGILQRDFTGQGLPPTVSTKWCQRFVQRHDLRQKFVYQNPSINSISSLTQSQQSPTPSDASYDAAERHSELLHITTLANTPMFSIEHQRNGFSSNGLIKYRKWNFPKAGNSSDLMFYFHGRLFTFFIQAFCPGRTLLQDNVYRGEVVEIARNHVPTKLMLMALSASYYKAYLESSSSSNWAEMREVKGLELNAVKRAANMLQLEQYPASYVNAANMLRVNYAIVNGQDWVELLECAINTGVDKANIVMTRHAIFVMPFLPLRSRFPFQDIDYGFLVGGSEIENSTMDGIIGTSREHLHFIYLITTEAKTPGTLDSSWLYDAITNATAQIEESNPRTQQIACMTAKVYNLAIQLYYHARVNRLSPSHPTMRRLSTSVIKLLSSLPATGDQYTGLHPAPAFPILCACTTVLEDYEKAMSIMSFIASENRKSNVAGLCKVMGGIWQWKVSNVKDAESKMWWELLMEWLWEFQDGKLVCLS